MSCLFCDLLNEEEKIVFQNDSFYVIYDNFPVNIGHCLLISKRHVESYFLLNEEEIKDLNKALVYMKNLLDKLYNPDGYNIGINDNLAAGQTIMHLHVHLIPRYFGDVDDPKGGVRGVIPIKQKY